MDKEYKLCKDVCKHEGCYCPKQHEFYTAVANTPLFLRVYFEKKGFNNALDNAGVVHGKDADRFMKAMNRKLTKKEKAVKEKFLKECSEIYNKMKVGENGIREKVL